MLMVIEALNYKSDEEVYQQNEMNNEMYRELAKNVMESNNINFQSFHNQSQHSLMVMSDQNSIEINKYNILQQAQEMTPGGLITNLHQESGSKGLNRSRSNSSQNLNKFQASSLPQDRSKNRINMKSLIESLAQGRNSIYNSRLQRQPTKSTTEVNEFQFKNRRKHSVLKTHPAYLKYNQVKAKPINKIRKIIPKKMVNKAISNIYSLKLEAVLQQSEGIFGERLYEFVYDLFMKKYGLKHVAEQNETENLIFYLGVLNFMNSLNLGTKIDNQDSNDSNIIAFVKIVDTLRVADLKFKNKNGVIDFDQLMLYLIPKWRSLTSEYQDGTIYQICKLICQDSIKEEEELKELNFDQFNLLVRSFDFVGKQKALLLFSEYSKQQSTLGFYQLKQMISHKKVLSINNFIKCCSVKFDRRFINKDLDKIKTRLEVSQKLMQYQDQFYKLKLEVESMQLNPYHDDEKAKLLYVILSKESRRIYVKHMIKSNFDKGLWALQKIPYKQELNQSNLLIDISQLDISNEQLITPRADELNLSNI